MMYVSIFTTCSLITLLIMLRLADVEELNKFHIALLVVLSPFVLFNIGLAFLTKKVKVLIDNLSRRYR